VCDKDRGSACVSVCDEHSGRDVECGVWDADGGAVHHNSERAMLAPRTVCRDTATLKELDGLSGVEPPNLSGVVPPALLGVYAPDEWGKDEPREGGVAVAFDGNAGSDGSTDCTTHATHDDNDDAGEPSCASTVTAHAGATESSEFAART
jgi:hypothetical protein